LITANSHQVWHVGFHGDSEPRVQILAALLAIGSIAIACQQLITRCVENGEVSIETDAWLFAAG
jgi:hypothetical protein